MQRYAAAVEADVPMELMLLPNRTHSTLARTRYSFRKLMNYFCQNLLGKVPPRNFRFGLLPQAPEPVDRETAG